jgi:hypothetical protein
MRYRFSFVKGMLFAYLRSNTREVKMRPVEFIIKEGDEHLTSHSGLALMGALMERMELMVRDACRLQMKAAGSGVRF